VPGNPFSRKGEKMSEDIPRKPSDEQKLKEEGESACAG